MKILKEITEWSADFTVPNHTYFVSDNKEKVYGYAKASDNSVVEFKAPYNFNSKYRKFVEVANTFNFSVQEDKPVFKGRIIKVTGSKGSEYTITVEGKHVTCDCTGFKFRGKCKHAESVFATD